MQLFSKSLTSTDVRKRLAIPTKIMTFLLPNRGDHLVELHVRHGTTGDVVTLYKEEDEAGFLDYKIEVKRADKPSPKHSSATVGDLPSGNAGEATCKSHRRFEDSVAKRFGVADEKVEKRSLKAFGVHVFENRPPADTSSYEATAGKAEITAREEKEYYKNSEGLSLDLTLAPPTVIGPR
ncbi:hypothetical protein SLEP1_g40828 [Rubroshorea leprosula]|uniref:Uncharacterized protein n=1 Tax=Rubroshorea leprosula TaxID=152421 RepID=A0AAV5L4T9_9ROSI|nr:hypothetical protein SLEP1_g40828 [Rubroshorea leprosula]